MPLLAVGRRSRSFRSTNTGQPLKNERTSTILSFYTIHQPRTFTAQGLSCVLTSRQVYSGTDVYPKSNIFFQLCSYSTFATGRRETRDFHPSLNHPKFAVQGHGSLFALTSFLLKACENYRGLCLSLGATQYPRFLLDTS